LFRSASRAARRFALDAALYRAIDFLSFAAARRWQSGSQYALRFNRVANDFWQSGFAQVRL